MALDMTPEQKKVGEANYQRVVGQLAEIDAKKEPSRREFMKGLLAASAAVPITAAAYYGYSHEKLNGKPVKAALIGGGDEGGVLVGAHNPNFLEFVAVCDIRPSNQKRIFTGEPTGPRLGFERIYGKDASKKIKVETDYHKILDNPEIEAVVIALPLNLHAPVAIAAMNAGKHVLCEKLMAWNITQCKDMIRVANEKDRVLSIGHQRHYSLLYAHAVEVLRSGVLGDVKHIRALWHRNNSWPRLDKDNKEVMENGQIALRDSWRPEIKKEDRDAIGDKVKQYGFNSLEELVRWRLYNNTGGGLMAELGSHQLDASSIFLGKVHPLAVSGIGGKYFYHDDREVEDHVFVTFEFPGKNYFKDKERKEIGDKDDKVIVTYSSINTNGFEPYGECVMGTRGTMVVEQEASVMLYPEKGGRSLAVSVSTGSSGQPVLDSSGSTGPGGPPVAAGQAAGSGPPSRGYREEMEHFAYCIRQWEGDTSKSDRPQPRCAGPAAMADAIIALTSNRAMRGTKENNFQPQRIEFKEEWFDPKNPAVPDADMVAKLPSEYKA